MKQISVKQAKRNRVLAKIKPPADGKCEKCHGKNQDWRGISRAHTKRRSDGTDDRRSNIKWLCYPCHNGPKGHKTETYEKPKPIDKVPYLAGYGPGRAFSKSEQVGKK